ncbi:MAG: hypothetical protein AAGC93_25040, partial [Cyanobacteria bacterium P01_F01_bin.53]
NSNPDTIVEFPIEGSGDSSEIVDDAYLLIQARGVSSNSHQIFVNNKLLPGIDLPERSGWQTWMDRIPPGLLRFGTNSIRITRAIPSSDEFYINGVVVNWRETQSIISNSARSDFNWVPINVSFNDNRPTTTVEFPIEGLDDFGGEPIDDAYLIIKASGVSSNAHRIFINNQPLPGIDLPISQTTTPVGTWMDRIPPGLLKEGTNTIRIDRIGEDNFFVSGVAINWRERGSAAQIPRNIVKSDFNWVTINQTFDDANPTVTVSFPIEGTDDVIDDGYLLIQARDVDDSNHDIYINNRRLPGEDILPYGPGYGVSIHPIPPTFLDKGTNTIRIDRIGGSDDFYVSAVAVNWREEPIPIDPFG